MTAHGKRRENADEDERAAHKRTPVLQINNNRQPEHISLRMQLVAEVSEIPCVHGEQRTHSIEELHSLGIQVQRVRCTAYGCGLRDTIKGLERVEQGKRGGVVMRTKQE
jgi:hypothetical protein